MAHRIFSDKKIIIRKLSRGDLKKAKAFQDFINSLVKEDAKVLINKVKSLKEEQKWLKDTLKTVKNNRAVLLIAQEKDKIIGIINVNLMRGRHGHVGSLGIFIRDGYRGIGLGKYLMREILKLVKRELKPKPKIIRLSVFPNNKPALNLYKKFGFQKIARIPKQIEYKGKLIDEIVMLLKLF